MDNDAISAAVILENVNDAVIAIDPDEHIVVWNHAAEDIYGWRVDEVLGRRLADIIPVLHYIDGSTETQVRTAFFEQGYWRGNVIQPHRDGHEIMIAASVRLLSFPDEAPRRLISVNRDITAQMHLTTQLKASEARFQAQYQSSPASMTIWQKTGDDFVLIEVNRAAREFTKGQIQPLFGARASVLYQDRPDILADFARCDAEQTTVQRERWWTLQTTGERRFIAATFAPIPPDMILIHTIDITARKLAEEALAQEYHRLQHILDIAPVAMAVFDREARYIAHSRRWIRAYGSTGQSFIGQRIQDYFPVFPAHWSEIVARALQGEAISAPEERWTDFDGKQRIVSWAITPWYEADATIGGIVIAVDDVTQLAVARDEAKQASRAKSVFLSSMSHELRTPLQTILGYAQILTDDLESPEHREYMSYILTAGEHLLTLINDVLDITRIENTGFEMRVEPAMLAPIVRESLRLIQQQATEQALHIEVDLASCQDQQVLADPQRLKQVLVNLLSNAVKYNVRGGGIRISCIESDKHMRIDIQDTGRGIAPDLIPRLFTPFDRLGAEKSRIGGIGLGLALSKQLMERMGGKIDVSSEVGIGSTFSVQLPQT